MPSKKKPLKIYLSEDEMQEVQKIANKGNISRSEFGKRCVLGRQLPDTQRQKDVLSLVKVNADLARLGNLQKMLMDDEDVISLIKSGSTDIDDLIKLIRNNQGEVQRLIVNLQTGGKRQTVR